MPIRYERDTHSDLLVSFLRSWIHVVWVCVMRFTLGEQWRNLLGLFLSVEKLVPSFLLLRSLFPAAFPLLLLVVFDQVLFVGGLVRPQVRGLRVQGTVVVGLGWKKMFRSVNLFPVLLTREASIYLPRYFCAKPC